MQISWAYDGSLQHFTGGVGNSINSGIEDALVLFLHRLYMHYFPNSIRIWSAFISITNIPLFFCYSFKVRNPLLHRPGHSHKRGNLHWKRHSGAWLLHAPAFGLRVQTELHRRSSMAQWNILLWLGSHWWGGKSKPNFKYHFGLHLWTAYDHH